MANIPKSLFDKLRDSRPSKGNRTMRDLHDFYFKSDKFLVDYSDIMKDSMRNDPLWDRRYKNVDSIRLGRSEVYDNFEAHTRSVMTRHRRYLDPSYLHNSFDGPPDPDFLEDFLWGPKGEWTGFVKPRDFKERVEVATFSSRRREYAFRLHYVSFDGRSVPSHLLHHYTMYRPGGIDLRRDGLRAIPLFDNYRDLGEYHNEFGSYRTPGALLLETMRLSGALQNAHVNSACLRDWKEDLARAKYKYGYGVMRSGTSRFDALGVLAERNRCEWAWDAVERGWSCVGGDAYAPAVQQMREWLMIPDSISDQHITDLIKEIATISDCEQSFEPIAALMDRATAVIADRQQALEAFSRTVPPDFNTRSVLGPVMPEDLHYDSISITPQWADPRKEENWRFDI